MKLTDEQLIDWFIVTCPIIPESARVGYVKMFENPPNGATRSQIRSGFKQGINDTLSDMWTHAPKEERDKMDSILAAKGLPSIFDMEVALKKKHRRILKRGAIKSDEEYYLVKNILDNLESEVSEAERAALEKLSGEFRCEY